MKSTFDFVTIVQWQVNKLLFGFLSEFIKKLCLFQRTSTFLIMELNKFRFLLVCLAVLACCQYIEGAAKFIETRKLPKYESNDTEHFLVPNPKYHTDEAIANLFANLTEKYPTLAKIHSLGESVSGRDLIAIQISKNFDQRGLLVPMFKYVANMHGDETVGRELLVYFAQYLLDNYGSNPEVTHLVDNTDIWLVPSMNPDGFNSAYVSLEFETVFVFYFEQGKI